MCAQKNIRVLLNTHSRRVHLQRIELEPLCTPTRTHAFTVTLCTQETSKHTLSHTHCFWQTMFCVYHQMCLLINRPWKQCGWWAPKHVKKKLKIMTDATFCSSRSLHVRSAVFPAVGLVSQSHSRRCFWPQKTNGYLEKSPCLPLPHNSLKAEIPPHTRLHSSTHTHTAALRGNSWKVPHQKVKTVQVEDVQVILWANRWTALVNGSFLIRFGKKLHESVSLGSFRTQDMK